MNKKILTLLSCMLIFLLGGSYTTDDVITKSPLMDVRHPDFGAVGDGVTDDTTAVQAAADAIKAAGGGTVIFPEGTFLVSGISLTYGGGSSGTYIFKGVGDRASLIKASGSSPVFTITTTGAMNTLLTIEHLGIDGNSKSAHGMKLTNVAYITMNNVTILNADRGLWFEGSLVTNCNQVRFTGNNYGVYGEVANTISPNLCRFTNCIFGSNTNFAVYWSGGNILHIDGCDFEGNGTSGDSTTGVIKRENVALPGPHTIIGNGSWFESNHGKADVWALSAHASSSLVIRDTLMYSSDVDYNVYADTNVLLFDGLVAVAQGGTVNNESIKTVSCTGSILNTIATSVDINSEVLTYPNPIAFTARQFNEILVKARSGNSSVRIDGPADGQPWLDFRQAGAYKAYIQYMDAGAGTDYLRYDAPMHHFTSGHVVVPSDVPATATSAGTAGAVTWDNDWIYCAVANNTWKRASIATWGIPAENVIYAAEDVIYAGEQVVYP